jgi:rubrerythrin
MTAIRRLVLFAGAVATVGVCVTGAPAQAATPPGASAAAVAVTLDNLQTAYNGESNARSNYLAFAAQADKDGYPAVASLFRAAASAEEIHAANHAVVIRQLGASPAATIAKPIVKSTEENLRVAIEGETYERDTMYPEFVKNAKAANLPDAVRTFTLALRAEAEHAKLYTSDLRGLAGLKDRAAVKYKVCPTCGFTTAKRDFKNCPACATPSEKFQVVS